MTRTTTTSRGVRGVSPWVVGTAIAGTVVIAAAAMWLSFTALTHLAERAGIATHQAWAWPLIVDGIIIVATVAVVALRGRPGSRYAWVMLGSGAAVSVTANAIHAAMPPGTPLNATGAAAISAVPPLVLLAVTHLTVVLARHPAPQPMCTTEVEVPPPPGSEPAASPETLPTGVKTPVSAPRSIEMPRTGEPLPLRRGLTPPPQVPASTPDMVESSGPDLPIRQTPPFPDAIEPPLSSAPLAPTEPKATPPPVADTPSTSEKTSRAALIAEATELKAKGLSHREIGKRLGVNHATVGRWLRPIEEPGTGLQGAATGESAQGER